MPAKITNYRVICRLEKLLARACILLYDGETRADFDGSKPTFYTRVYQLTLDGEKVATKFKFTYDERSHFADFTVSWHGLEEWEKADKKEVICSPSSDTA